jgi:hypothetical protein
MKFTVISGIPDPVVVTLSAAFGTSSASYNNYIFPSACKQKE